MGFHSTERRVCQSCGAMVMQLANHVKGVHKTTITDLIAEGKWKNESIWEHEIDKARYKEYQE